MILSVPADGSAICSPNTRAGALNATYTYCRLTLIMMAPKSSYLVFDPKLNILNMTINPTVVYDLYLSALSYELPHF